MKQTALTLAIVALASCPPTPTPPPTQRAIGVVVSSSGLPVAGAAVTLDALTATTDTRGYAGFTPVTVPVTATVTVDTATCTAYRGVYQITAGTPDIPITLTCADPIPPPPTVLRGQFVIQTPNPFAATYPQAKPDRFFMAELDSVWKVNRDEAQRILDVYKALGFNHVPAGTPIDHGYSGHYPDANWKDDIEGYADFLEWLRRNGVVYTLFLIPDYAPYFLGIRDGFGFEAIERDLTPIFLNPRIQALTLRTATIWEQWAPIAQMGAVFDYQRRMFPNAERCWHNGVGHLSPGGSDESEEGAWRSAAQHGITGFCYQATPDGWEADRPPMEQLQYDLWDMARRFGIGPGVNPWGTPVRRPDGSALTLDWLEGTAYPAYWNATFPSALGPAWGAAAKSVTGVRFALDGMAP